MVTTAENLPHLRFTVDEGARVLKFSRAQFYNRVRAGEIALSKDGARSYVTAGELERYVLSKAS